MAAECAASTGQRCSAERHHLGGRVEVGLAAPEQLPGSVGQLSQEVLRVSPEAELVRPPLHQNMYMPGHEHAWHGVSEYTVLLASSHPRNEDSLVAERAPDAHRLLQNTGCNDDHFRSICQRQAVWPAGADTALAPYESPQTSKEGEPQQLSSPRQGAKALERALRMCSEKRPDFSLIIGDWCCACGLP